MLELELLVVCITLDSLELGRWRWQEECLGARFAVQGISEIILRHMGMGVGVDHRLRRAQVASNSGGCV